MHFNLFGRPDLRVHVEDHTAETTPSPGEERMQQQAVKLKVWGIQTTKEDGTVTSWSHMVGTGTGFTPEIASTEVDDTPVVEAADPMQDPAVVAVLKENADEIIRLTAELADAKEAADASASASVDTDALDKALAEIADLKLQLGIEVAYDPSQEID